MHSYDPKWFRMKYGSLLRSIVSRANRRKRSRRSSAVCDADANPPAPTFEPPRPSNDIFFCAMRETDDDDRDYVLLLLLLLLSHSKGFQSNWTTRESEKKSVRRFRDERREKTNTPRTQHRLPRCTTRVKPNRCYYSCTKTSLYIYICVCVCVCVYVYISLPPRPQKSFYGVSSPTKKKEQKKGPSFLSLSLSMRP